MTYAPALDALNPTRSLHSFVPQPSTQPSAGVWLTTGEVNDDTLQMSFIDFFNRTDESIDGRFTNNFKKLGKKIKAAVRTVCRAPGQALRAMGTLARKAWEDVNPPASQYCSNANCSGHGPAPTDGLEAAIDRLKAAYANLDDERRRPLTLSSVTPAA